MMSAMSSSVLRDKCLNSRLIVTPRTCALRPAPRPTHTRRAHEPNPAPFTFTFALALATSRRRGNLQVASSSETYEELEFFIDVGMYDNPMLTEPTAFWKLCDSVSSKVKAELSAIKALVPGPAVVQRLDSIMLTISSVALPAAHCRAHHQDPNWQEAAAAALGEMDKLVSSVLVDADLFASLADSMQHIPAGPEHGDIRLAAERLMLEYQRRGTASLVGLEPNTVVLRLQELRLLRAQEEKLALQLMRLKYDRDAAPNYVMTNLPSQMHPVERAMLERTVIKRVKEEGVGGAPAQSDFVKILPLTADVVRYFLEEHPEESFRRGIYRLGVEDVRGEVMDTLDRVRAVRQRLAQAAGQPTWAHFALQGTLAGSPEAVQQLLESVLGAIAPKVKDEVVDLRLLKRRLGATGGGVEGPGSYDPLYAWDVDRMSSMLMNMRTEAGQWWPEVEAYFTEEGLVQGLERVLGTYFGLDVEEWEVEQYEQYGPDVRKFSLTWRDSGDVLGDVYLDPHGSPDGAPSCMVVRNASVGSSSSSEGRNPPAVCVTGAGADCQHPLQVVVFGRVIGHALYLLSSAQQPLASLQYDQAPPELEEAVCSLVQGLLQLPAVLHQLGCDPDTGDRLPTDLAQILGIFYQEFFTPLKLQEYTLLALTDLSCHWGLPAGPGGPASSLRDTEGSAGVEGLHARNGGGVTREGGEVPGWNDDRAGATGSSKEIWEGVWDRWSSLSAGGSKVYMTSESYNVEDMLSTGGRVYKLVYGKCLAALLLKRFAEEGLSSSHGRRLVEVLMQRGPALSPADLVATLVEEGLLQEGDIACSSRGDSPGYVPVVTADLLLKPPEVVVPEEQRPRPRLRRGLGPSGRRRAAAGGRPSRVKR